MKIVDVQATPIRSSIPTMDVGGGVPVEIKMHSTFVKVSTDEGLEGFGESWVQETDEEILAVGINKGLGPLIVGEDPLETERLWRKMWKVARNHGLHPAISAIDIALWDLKGKYLGIPIHQLLGGKVFERVQAYATTPLRKSAEELAQQITQCHERGFAAAKFAIGRGVDQDKALIAEIKQAIPEEMGISVDANGYYDFHDALDLANFCSDLGIRWFEEPLPHTQEQLLSELRSRVSLPISGFQFGTGIDSIHRHLRAGSLDIYQPSLDKCGGISQAHKMSVLVEAWGQRIIPHSFAPTLAFCAAIHVAACAPSGGWMEFPVPLPKSDDPGQFAFDNVLADTSAISLSSDGFVRVPDAPGLGVDVDEERVMEFSLS